MPGDDFLSSRPYDPDPFQWEAARAVETSLDADSATKVLVSEVLEPRREEP